LLTGKRLFQGEDVTDTLAKVIQAEPNLDDVPAAVQRLLRSCLEKDPAKRLRDIGDAWRLLDSPDKPVRSGRRSGWIVAAALLAVIAALAFWSPWRSEKPFDRALVRLDVDLGPDVSLTPNQFTSTVAISPDGNRIVYMSGANQPRLFTRRLD